ncbi:nucleotidyltransferase domain-containing protein [Candidatus Micrarchaeota archaeon]|nr:nucleotidyltransferase domain-containing protein [Candidatus Micrarchaeota archaeon]MBI5177148.1 nucleotidyltransferase domain-containing protein [Candidatus Micrarchaeota archaeon]
MGKDEGLIRRLKVFFKQMSRDFHFQQVILFGSAAEGRAGKDSDIDLIVVSEDFAGKKFHERPGRLHLAWDLGVPVDLLCFTPSEFAERSRGVNIVSHALKHGLRIA